MGDAVASDARVAVDAATGGGPDPMLLPEADGQRAAAVAPAVEPGASYLDPSSGARVWRVTGPDAPEANTGAHHDYSNGPNQISGALDDGSHILLVYLDGVGHRLVDFTPGVGVSNWRAPVIAPASDLSFTFSSVAGTAHLAYVVASDGSLHRIDARANVVMDGDGFPVAGFGTWLQQDQRDEWFVSISGGEAVVAWNRSTGARRERSFAGLDEPYLEHEGQTVLINTGGTATPPLWDLAGDTLRAVTSPTRIFHSGAMRGYWTAADVDIGGGRVPYYRLSAASATADPVLDYVGYQSAFHMAGQWLQGDLGAAPTLEQWVLLSFYGGFESGGPLVDRAIGLFRLDGSGGFRFLAHSYTSAGAGYWELPRATISPDGTLVMFDSDRGGVRGDVFVIEMPLRD
ncbi:MAG TPA: hypothetical protein VML75_18205 [Kofleriaceae bacterium]|nr:hypothetical protein [Kofleriaceae bacterium]